MSLSSGKTRRSFLKKALGTAIATSAAPYILQAKENYQIDIEPRSITKKYGPNDQVNVAAIGAGIMGSANMDVTQKVAGVKLVAVCDLYTGRLDHAKELYGNDLFTTKNYLDILERKDIDAIIISTTDHWHDRISIDALNKGKHVYCEKPMVHKLEEGAAVIAAQKKTGKVFQVGSQRVSSIVTEKAKEIYESGAIGDLVLVETFTDRQGPGGAWQYSIPTDASPDTIDWERFIGNAPKVPFDPIRFFRWRNYQDYGTGIAGDLFVHLFSGLHTVISAKGPSRIYASGGLRYWKDGRDTPDVITSIHDYPATDKHAAFNLQMRVNFVDGSGGGEQLRLVGTDGVIIVDGGGVKVKRSKTSKIPPYGGWDSFKTFTAAQQKDFEKWYKEKYPVGRPEMEQPEIAYNAPKGYSANLDHHANFYAGIREGKPVKEDALFSMRAAGPALATNKSYFEQKVINWDPENAKVI
jgi:predicted dehydrogenase